MYPGLAGVSSIQSTAFQPAVDPYPAGIGSSGQWMEPQKYRFNWNAPIVLSPEDPKTVYYGGNVLFKTTNYGHFGKIDDLTSITWEKTDKANALKKAVR